MKLIVGLGNPGKEYENTRHNIGFMVIDEMAKYLSVHIDKEKFGGLYTKLKYNDEDIILLKPQKYINLSGEVIIKYVNFFKINIDDILIISDDLDMETGKIKIKHKGSSGGHNGLKNIELHLNTKEYKRIKIGISNNKLVDTKNYVLGKLNEIEKNKINEVIKKVPQILDEYLSLTFDNFMNRYNKK